MGAGVSPPSSIAKVASLANGRSILQLADAIARGDRATAVFDLAGNAAAARGDRPVPRNVPPRDFDELSVERAAVELRRRRPSRC